MSVKSNIFFLNLNEIKKNSSTLETKTTRRSCLKRFRELQEIKIDIVRHHKNKSVIASATDTYEMLPRNRLIDYFLIIVRVEKRFYNCIVLRRREGRATITRTYVTRSREQYTTTETTLTFVCNISQRIGSVTSDIFLEILARTITRKFADCMCFREKLQRHEICEIY